jgi:hypothetical protein
MLVFKQTNLKKIREATNNLFDIFHDVLEKDFEYGAVIHKSKEKIVSLLEFMSKCNVEWSLMFISIHIGIAN